MIRRALVAALLGMSLLAVPATEAAALAAPESATRPKARPSAGMWRPIPNKWRDSGVPAVWSGVPLWIRNLGLCIRTHESIDAGHYLAENGGPHGGSSAAGAYQIIDSTWQGVVKWVRVLGRPVPVTSHASYSAPWVQDAVFVHMIRHGGVLAWRGTHCGYGT